MTPDEIKEIEKYFKTEIGQSRTPKILRIIELALWAFKAKESLEKLAIQHTHREGFILINPIAQEILKELPGES